MEYQLTENKRAEIQAMEDYYSKMRVAELRQYIEQRSRIAIVVDELDKWGCISYLLGRQFTTKDMVLFYK